MESHDRHSFHISRKDETIGYKEVVDRSDQFAKMYKALGDPTRLRIFEFLRQRCCPVAVGEGGDVHPVDGPSVGEVCCYVTGKDRINSTISFHIGELKDAGLITVDRRGRFMVCGMNHDAISQLASHLSDHAAATPCGEPL